MVGRSEYVLFFDGGSRGNPGPGGSGSVIVKLTGATGRPCIVWVAAMAYSRKTTTNNQAEYRGLCAGLQEAAKSGFHPLTVIGDSMLIINHMKKLVAPASAALLPM